MHTRHNLYKPLDTWKVGCPECQAPAGKACFPSHHKYEYCRPHCKVWTHKARHTALKVVREAEREAVGKVTGFESVVAVYVQPNVAARPEMVKALMEACAAVLGTVGTVWIS